MRRNNIPAKRNRNGAVPTDHVFEIKLRSTGEKIDLTDPGFLKMLQLEYATKYLELLKIQPTSKNVQNIVKRNPLSKCVIQESRLSGGLHTDTITIIHKNNVQKPLESDEETPASEEMIKSIGLKKLKTDVFKKSLIEAKIKPTSAMQIQKEDDIKVDQVKFDFDIQKVKSKYIFPFNQSYLRKSNCLMRDKGQYNIQQKGQKLILQSKIFSFPFSQIKVSITALKQLQTIITLTTQDIQNKLQMFCNQFPRSIFPVRTYRQTQQLKQSTNVLNSKNMLTFQQLQKLFDLLRSEEMAKLMGAFIHFAYWSVFGNVNPINIDSAVKKQMYLSMFQIIQYFHMNCQNKKLWQTLYLPMILLTIKMLSDFTFRQLYPQFFDQNSFDTNPAGNIASDKILFLVQNIFDRENLKGRFTFLETSFNERQCLSNDRKNIRKRIYGTSPMLNMILPNPKNGKARAIMAKKHQIQIQEGIFNQPNDSRSKSQPMDLLSKLQFDRKKQNENLQKKCQERMLNVVLSKLQSKIQSKLGPNHIISLGNVQS